jgi:hypothetical protein
VIGCLDCGAVYERKADIPAWCRDYAWHVVALPDTGGRGYEITEQVEFETRATARRRRK